MDILIDGLGGVGVWKFEPDSVGFGVRKGFVNKIYLEPISSG
jgi:hypothetical protein